MNYYFGRIYSPGIDGHNAISAAKSKGVTQKVMADFYAACLRAGECDWPAINAAIMERWPNGLQRIKNAAWKIHLAALANEVRPGDNAPKIEHAGCAWLLMVAEHGDGTKPKAGHLACPACGKQVPATPEQIAQAVQADEVWNGRA